MPVPHDHVTQSMGSVTFTDIHATSKNDIPPYKTKELWNAHDRTPL